MCGFTSFRIIFQCFGEYRRINIPVACVLTRLQQRSVRTGFPATQPSGKFLIQYALIIIIGTVFVVNTASFAQEVPFQRGVNLTTWFQVSNAKQIQFTKYTRQDFENIKSLGCDAIRLPINLHFMTNGAPNYTLDPLFLQFLDEAVSWAEELEIHLILDNHTIDPAEDTDPDIGSILEKVWAQMAEHYKDRSEYIYYEVLNEPHGISDEQWNAIQQKVVKTIRAIDTKHYIVIGPAGWNSFHNLDAMPVYEDEKLIYTFHFYDPFIFTHQGASWSNPSMGPLADVPFPYNASEMPQFPDALKGTWIESAFNDYKDYGNVASVKSLLDIAVAFKNSRNVPVFCGEFGVYIPNSQQEDRVFWYEVVREYLEEKNIPWTTWDYHGGFGLFKEGGNDLFQHDLNVPLLEALDFNVPEQTEFSQQPDSTGFMIYTDFIGDQVFQSGNSDGIVDFYAEDKPNNEKYCMYWTGAEQYSTVAFDFKPNKDLTKLVNEGYALDFMVRGNTPASFDMRFVDTDEPDDHPWRMRITLDENDFPFDGRWHHLHIPFQDFAEQGAWEGEWFPPEDKFDWAAIDQFAIVAEHQDMDNIKLWFDNIHVTNEDTAQVYETSVWEEVPTATEDPEADRIVNIYPNPTDGTLNIQASFYGSITYRIQDKLGRTLLEGSFRKNAEINTATLPRGIYFVQLFHRGAHINTRKVIKTE